MIEDLEQLRITTEPRGDSVIVFLRNLWQLVWPRRRLFLRVAAITAPLAVALMLLVPRQYTARAKVLPAGSKTGSMIGILTQVTGMTSLGDIVSTESILPLYPSIARSRGVLWATLHMPYKDGTILSALANNPAADSIDAEKMLETVSDNLVAKTDLRVGLVLIEYTLADKYLATAVVNGLLEQMDHFFRYNLMTEAKHKRMMIEKRVSEVADTLHFAEDRLQKFSAMNRSIGGSPALQMEERRLRRELEIQNAVYVELNRQLELARIQEVADTPVMKILDRATPPYYKSWPPRGRYVVLILLLSQFATLLYVKGSQMRRLRRN